jgi:hypothetical protein
MSSDLRDAGAAKDRQRPRRSIRWPGERSATARNIAARSGEFEDQ